MCDSELFSYAKSLCQELVLTFSCMHFPVGERKCPSGNGKNHRPRETLLRRAIFLFSGGDKIKPSSETKPHAVQREATRGATTCSRLQRRTTQQSPPRDALTSSPIPTPRAGPYPPASVQNIIVVVVGVVVVVFLVLLAVVICVPFGALLIVIEVATLLVVHGTKAADRASTPADTKPSLLEINLFLLKLRTRSRDLVWDE